MKNIELKISIDNKEEIIALLKQIKATDKWILIQEDTYFISKNWRLKLREINNSQSELIYYERPNTNESKISDYNIINLDENQSKQLKNILSKTNEIKVVVKKNRNLWIYKNTRIHIDQVDNLGNFLELETVIQNIDLIEGEQEHFEVIRLLEISNNKKFEKSYSDLLLERF